MQQVNVYMYSCDSWQLKTFDEVCCCFCKNVENSEIFAKYFIHNRYCESMFTSLFLHSRLESFFVFFLFKFLVPFFSLL